MNLAELTADEVLEALRVCFDPELPVNIVDLGLVYGVDVQRDCEAPGLDARYAVRVTVTMRAPNDEREAMLVAQVQNRLMGLREISRVAVAMTWHPAWTAERMSPAARKQLGFDRKNSAKQELVTIKL